MQIHELNNYNGNLDSSAYLAVDNGSDTGKVSTVELLADTNAAVSQLDTVLNGRIDNIVAGGEAPSASEIVDARLGADGVTYPSLGSAIRDQVTDLKSDLDNYAKKAHKNLFDLSAITEGFMSAYNGNIDPNANYDTSDYIFVPSGKSIVISPRIRSFLVFNTNKEYIKETYSANVEANKVFTATDDCYIRFSFFKSDTNVQAEYGTVPTAYESYEDSYEIEDGFHISETFKEDVKALMGKYVEKSEKAGKNLFDKSAITEGYLSSYNGNIDPSSTYHTSDFIFVPKGESIVISPRVRSFLAFTKSKAYIRDTWISTVKNNYTFSYPDDCYIRFSFYVTQKDEIQAEYGTVSTEYEPFAPILTIDDSVHLSNTFESEIKNIIRNAGSNNVLFGKKWCVVGDSFTNDISEGYDPTWYRADGTTPVYPRLIAERNNMILQWMAVGGRTMATPSDGSFTNAFSNGYYQNIENDVDYITIMLGINDGHHAGNGNDGEDMSGNIPLGTINDTTTGTFYGAWNVVIPYLMEHHPNAHIGIIVSNGMDTMDYRNAEIQIAKKYGIPYIDLNGDERTTAMHRPQNDNIPTSVKNILLNKWSIDADGTKYGNVNTHPNADAHMFESYAIENFMRSI